MKHFENITNDIVWLGASDRRLSRFENLFPLPNGVSYNSYLVLDEKTALFDTIDASVSDLFFENLTAALDGRSLDYMIVQHMEPDHCANLARVLALYPEATLVCSAQAFTYVGQFFPALRTLTPKLVKEGDTLSTGKHNFHFVAAPMVHWPEVLVTYDDVTKILFSADAFGTFGSVDGSIYADEHDWEKEYLDESRRYYANIVGKYGMPVQTLLKKASGLDISMICPLHGPIIRKDLTTFISLYDKWSRLEPESDDAILIYGSLYGNTANAAAVVASKLHAASGNKIAVYDVSDTDLSYLISEIWRVGTVILMCPTYNGGLYPKMAALLEDMSALAVGHRHFALCENGTWAPMTVKLMTEKLSALKDCTISPVSLTIRSALSEDDDAKVDAFVAGVYEV